MQEPRLRKVRKQPQGHTPSERQSQDFNTKPEALTILPIQKYREDGDSCLPHLGRGCLLQPLRPEQCRSGGKTRSSVQEMVGLRLLEGHLIEVSGRSRRDLCGHHSYEHHCQLCFGCYKEKGSPEEHGSSKGIKIKPDAYKISKYFSWAVLFPH